MNRLICSFHECRIPQRKRVPIQAALHPLRSTPRGLGGKTRTLTRYDDSVARNKLQWQSKSVLLLVFPAIGAYIVLETRWWLTHTPYVAIWTFGLSTLLGLVAWKLRSATAGAALAGMAITASMMFATTSSFPYLPWKTALVPILTVLILTSLATRVGHKHKENLGTAESRTGREASQVAANLGIAALVSNPLIQIWLTDHGWVYTRGIIPNPAPALALGLAALAEAAADTVSSELGQVLSGHPRMITTFRKAEPGTDGAISLGGTAMGIIAAAAVAAAGSWAFGGGTPIFMVSWAGGVFGLLFDSLLGATLERRGWINNDAVNFLSAASAAAFALAISLTRAAP
jgi:uncharacterized protein (TIGR00297 family)